MSRSLPATCVALLVALTVAGCGGSSGSKVSVAKVARGTVTEVVEAPATVSAKASAQVTAAADGRVSEVRVREGQHVRTGQVLLRLDSPQARRALREAKAADANAASAGNVPVVGTGLTAQQRAADADARRAFTRAGRAAARITDPQVRRQAVAAVRASEAQYAAAQAQARGAIAQFQAGFGSLASAVSALSAAQCVQTRAAVAAAQRSVDALVVRAPITGTVSFTQGPQSSSGSGTSALVGQLPEALQSQAGQLLGAGGSTSSTVTGAVAEGQPVSSGQALATVTDASALSLTAQVDETDVLLVKPGVEATAELDAVPDASYDASVSTLDPVPTTSSRGGVVYLVRLSLGLGHAADGSIAPTPRPGMSAVARLTVRTAKDVVAAPVSAVFRDGRHDAVWVVLHGKARKRLVRLGAQGQSNAEVVEGLQPGELIVVRGADRVRPGQQVP
ncbi:MAG: efflux RND transporter periplasmic adaptor subunit [Actinomycetes bacterium]